MTILKSFLNCSCFANFLLVGLSLLFFLLDFLFLCGFCLFVLVKESCGLSYGDTSMASCLPLTMSRVSAILTQLFHQLFWSGICIPKVYLDHTFVPTVLAKVSAFLWFFNACIELKCIEHLLCGTYSAKCFTYIISLYPCYNLEIYTLLIPFYEWESEACKD